MRSSRRTPHIRTALLLLAGAAVAAALAGTAEARTQPPQQPMRVLIVPRITPAQLEKLAQRGAVGALVPGVGPTTNRRRRSPHCCVAASKTRASAAWQADHR